MRTEAHPFDIVRKVGLALPDVQAATRYDGSPVLKAGGAFMAGLARHRSAEPKTLIVRADFEDREWLMPYPVVLARLSRIDRDALRDLLLSSWRLTMAKRPRTAKTIPIG